MKTTKWLATIILIIGMATNSYAQSANAAASQAKQLQVQLKLTDLQTAKITTVIQQMGKEQANDKAAQAQLKHWQDTHNTKAIIDYILKQLDVNAARIEQVLTAEQKKTFQEMVEKRRDGLKKMAASQQ